jgi:hypothetical protein
MSGSDVQSPVCGSQLSAVQSLLSSQAEVLPAQAPPLQLSAVVQASPSLQDAVLFVLAQPLVASQLSVVQGLLSSQFFLLPDWHLPALQKSCSVQILLSVQLPEVLV